MNFIADQASLGEAAKKKWNLVNVSVHNFHEISSPAMIEFVFVEGKISVPFHTRRFSTFFFFFSETKINSIILLFLLFLLINQFYFFD